MAATEGNPEAEAKATESTSTKEAVPEEAGGSTAAPEAEEKTPEEIKQVDDVLNNAALRDLLMDPKTQLLMQRCADPREFQRAMMNPDERAIIRKLAKEGKRGRTRFISAEGCYSSVVADTRRRMHLLASVPAAQLADRPRTTAAPLPL